MALKTKLKVNKVIKFIKNIQILFVLYVLLFIAQPSFAASSYVLPYPSTMPGSVFYKVSLVKEKVMQYWYYGNFGQFFYNLKQSDKYLVEAKTLFEYNQYLLGFQALQKSNDFFVKTKPYLINAQKEGKDTSENINILSDAALKHAEVLSDLRSRLPESFVWTPEREKPTNLKLKQIIEQSIKIRKKYL